MKEIICGAVGLLCATAALPANDKGPFNRRVDPPLAAIVWDISPDIVNGLIRDYLRSKGEVVQEGKISSFECRVYNDAGVRTCRYVVWIEVPFDATNP